MSPGFPARRRAEQFDALVEGTSTQPFDPALGNLLELVGTLRSAPRVEARPEFVLGLRERLMVAAAAEMSPARAVRTADLRPRRSTRDRRLATALGGFALVGATASMAVAAQNALPGDQLYPMKRAMENAHASLSQGNDGKGSTLLANASDRLDEVAALTDGSHSSSPEAISETLTAFTAQATQASSYLLDAYTQDGNTEAIDQLASFTQDSASALSEIAPEVPADAKDALAAASRTISAIHAAAVATCPACGVPVLNTTAAGLEHTIKHSTPKSPTTPVALPTSIPSSAFPTSLPPTVQPSAAPTDVPTTTPTAPATTVPTPSADPTTPSGHPTVLPTAPSSHPSQSPGSNTGSSGGSDDPLHLGSGGINTGTPQDPASIIPSIIGDVTGAVSGLLPGAVPGSAPSSQASSTPSSTSSSGPKKHHKHKHHHAQGSKQADSDSSDDGGLNLLGD